MSFICPMCVNDEFLKQLITERASKEDPCEYCESGLPGLDIQSIAELLDAVIDVFYEAKEPTIGELHHRHRPIGMTPQELVEELACAGERAAGDVTEALRLEWVSDDGYEDKYGNAPYFVERDQVDSPHIAMWSSIESSLRTEARFVNPKVGAFLDQVFEGLDEITSGDASVVVEAGPGTSLTSLVRARVFDSEQRLENALARPERELGAPPAEVNSVGRMN